MNGWSFEFWHWWALALLFAVLEMLLPGIFFLWLAISGGMLGFILLGFPALTWETQLILFSVGAVSAFVLSRLYLRRNPTPTSNPTLNRRGEQYLGRVFTLEHPILNNYGHIRVDDSTWKIHGADLAAGAKIKIIAITGTIFEVEAAPEATQNTLAGKP